jgi:3-phenylpropionate/trans-cinnamate dioxygenase ferredoxin reductase subunit
VPDPVVIVGGSLAGLRAAEALRHHGYDGPLVVVGAEAHEPYDRPPLSKQVLTGDQPPAATALDVPADLGAEWWRGVRATGLDLDRRRVVTDGGPLAYRAVLIATGAEPRVLPSARPGPGVHYLRTLDDAVALRDDLGRTERLVVIGAGFIGLEVASSAMKLGVPVAVVEALPQPLERGLGPQVAAMVAAWLRAKGVDLRTGAAIDSIVADRGTGRPARVLLAGGGGIDADTVVVGVGVAPATTWLESSGLDLTDGVGADRHLQATRGGRSVPGVYAAGDVVRWFHPRAGEAVRVEHWTHAGESAEVAAANLLAEWAGGPQDDYDPVPYFWSDQQGVKLQFVGTARADDDVAVLEGSFDEDRVLVGYGRGGRLVAALGIRRAARVMALQAQIAQGAPWPPEQPSS